MGIARRLGGVFGAAVIGLVPFSAASEPQAFTIELNDAVDVDGGCRIAYVAFNGTELLLEQASFEVVIFDADGRVGPSLVFQFGRLPAGKTRVVQFDLEEQQCGDISRLLINDVTECVAEGEESTVCLDSLTTTTRAPIAFGL
jgi:hypothetical protein